LKRGIVIVLSLTVASAGLTPARAESKFIVRKLPHTVSLAAHRFPGGRLMLKFTLDLAARESRLVTARLRARNASVEHANQQVGIKCDYGDRVDGTRTAKNNLGRLHRYPEGLGVMTVVVRYLVATDLPATVTCGLWAQSSGKSMVALAKGTFLTITRQAQVARQWTQGRCDSTGRRGRCVYLVPPGARQKTYRDRAYVLSSTALADPRAKAMEILADVELSTCYKRTGSCTPRVSKYGGDGGSTGVVETRLEVTPIDYAGVACGPVTFDPAPRKGNGTHRAFRRFAIWHRVHHYKTSHRLVARLPATCGAGGVSVRVYVRSLRGDPIKVEGSLTYDAGHGKKETRSYTSAIARSL
jgi:hypothetical protein